MNSGVLSMISIPDQLLRNATDYLNDRKLEIVRFLGDGNDGAVWETSRETAVKAIERGDSYRRERDCYFRLQDLGWNNVLGLALPCLIEEDDSRQIIEMTIVFPPYVLDFAKSYVDSPPDFSPESLDEWRAEMEELFSDEWDEQDWILIDQVLAAFRSIGIYYFDLHSRNLILRPN